MLFTIKIAQYKVSIFKNREKTAKIEVVVSKITIKPKFCN